MRFTGRFFAGALLIAFAASGEEVHGLFDRAISEIGANSPAPLYLPTVIPDAIASYGIKLVLADRTDDGYVVSLYYSEDTSNATFAGSISGSTKLFDSLPNTISVRLSSGADALFRPVQCGGSCAPANLWWQMGGVQYSVQVKLPSNLSEESQKRVILEMANSMSPAH